MVSFIVEKAPSSQTKTNVSIDQRLVALGIELPKSNPPAANYVPFVVVNNQVYISGQTAKKDGLVIYKGKVGQTISLDDAKQAARLCGLNLLLQLKHACDGNLDKVKRCVKLGVYIQCGSDFQDHAQVANGVSDLMVDVFGNIGHHTRTAVGAVSLPSDTAVEVDATFEV